MNLPSVHRLITLTAVCLLLNTPLRGQSDTTATDSLRTYRLGELIVSASRFEQHPARVGRNVTVITRREIAAAGRTSVADLLADQPGVHMIGSRQTPGSLQQGFLRSANNNHSMVMIDGVRISDPSTVNHSVDLSELSLAGVERIEIVRGSHSTLYGSSAIGGVVNIITRREAGQQGGYLDLKSGHGTVGRSGYATGNSLSGGYTFRSGWYVNGTVHQRYSSGIDATVPPPGTDEPFRPGDRDRFRKGNLTGSVGYERDRLRLHATGRWTGQRTELDQAAFSDDDNARVDFGRTMLSYGAAADLTDRFTLSFDGTWSGLDRDFVNDSSLVAPGVWDGTYTETRSGGRLLDHEMLAVFRGDRLRLSAGLSHIRQGMESRTRTYVRAFDFRQTTELDSLSEHTTGAFLHADLDGSLAGEVLDPVSLVVGGRLVRHDAFGTHETWEVNPRLRLGGGSLLYASASTGFNAPSLYQLYSPEQGFGAYTSRGNRELEPERSISWELGWKQPVGERVRMELSLFHTQVRNVIEYVYLWNGDREIPALDAADYRGDTYLNLSRQDIRGVEMALKAQPVNGVFLEGNITLNSTSLHFTPSDIESSHTGGNHVQVFESGIFVDAPAELGGLTRRPGVHGAFAVNWQPSPALDLRFATRYVGERDDIHYRSGLGPFGALDRQTLEGYHLSDLQATWRFSPGWSLTGGIDNLFNRRYRELAGYRTRGRGFHLNVAWSL